MTSEKRRKAAKSLTTLFDKAAIQRLNDQSETVSDHLHRYFNSISSQFKPESLTASTKQHSKKVRRHTQPALDHDRYNFPQQDASSENIRLSQEPPTKQDNVVFRGKRRKTFAGEVQPFNETSPTQSSDAEKENRNVFSAKASAETKSSAKEKHRKSLKKKEAKTKTKLRKSTPAVAVLEANSSARIDATTAAEVPQDVNTQIISVENTAATSLSKHCNDIVEAGIEHSTASRHSHTDETESLPPPSKRPRTQESMHAKLRLKEKRQKQPSQLEETSSTSSKQQSMSKKSSKSKLDEVVSGNVTGNKRPCSEPCTPVVETTRKEAISMSPEQGCIQGEEDDFLVPGDGGSSAYDGWHVVRRQVSMLREPVMFGGIVKHKFQALLKAHDGESEDTDGHMHEGVITQAMKRYNKKLLAHHHHHSETSETKQKRAVAILTKFHQLNDSNSAKADWKNAPCDLNFDFPNEMPTQCNASRSQYDKYAALATSIDRLRKDRKRKHAVLKSMLEVLIELDHVKKVDDRFMAEPCSSHLVARHHAAQICSASHDAQAVVSILLNNASESDDGR